jgi:hypothetical protein
MSLDQSGKKSDQEVKTKLAEKKELEESFAQDYPLFFERPLFFGFRPVILSLLFGLVLLISHASVAYFYYRLPVRSVFEDFSYFLAVLNGLGLWLVFNATRNLRSFVVNLIFASKQDNEIAKGKFISTYKESLLGKKTIVVGLIFGFLNILLAWKFGISYLSDNKEGLAVTFLLQVFLIGFIGGVTIVGLYVVVKLINKLSFHEDIELMYFYPDQCAGTLILGHILFKLSLHFIIIGVCIFIFLHNFEWLNNSTEYYFTTRIIVAWKLFPFLLSALIFFVPAQKINRILTEYKLYEHLRIRKRMSRIAESMVGMKVNGQDDSELNNIYNHYTKLKEVDSAISGMNTWPYNLKYRAIFLGFALPIISAIIVELSKEYLSK